MVYYNQDQNLLYILAGGKFYKIDLTKDEQTVLAKNLEEGQYTVSADGHLIAYQTSGTINTAQEIKVLNLKTDEENAVAAKSGSNQTAWIYRIRFCVWISAAGRCRSYGSGRGTVPDV